MSDITVCVPSIPPRGAQLTRALASVITQQRPPTAIIVEIDHGRRGAGPTRDRALRAVSTPWVAFLDDDDELDDVHLGVLRTWADLTNADVVYSGCRVTNPRGRVIPLREEWGRFGQKFDAELLRRKPYLPVTCLIRTELAQEAGFRSPERSQYDDWEFYLRVLDTGAQFSHVPQVTWTWHHHGANTSGQPDRW